MFSVPLGIMFGADVSRLFWLVIFLLFVINFSSLLRRTSASTSLIYSAYRLLNQRPCVLIRSLIAAFFGNVVGALLVALPATYFYLLDHDAGGLRAAENGELVSDRLSNGHTSHSNEKR